MIVVTADVTTVMYQVAPATMLRSSANDGDLE